MNIEIIEIPHPPKSERLVKEISIPGKSTAITQLYNNFSNQKITAKFITFDTDNIDNISSWLSGRGKLIYSDNPDKYYNVLMESAINFIRISDGVAEMTIDIVFEPFAYAVAENLIDIKSYTSYNSIINNGTVYSEPIITFKPIISTVTVLKGDVNFDGKVDAVDASMVMNEYTNVQNGGTPTFTDAQKSAADINGDGKIDATDAAAILQIYTETQSSSINENPSVQVKIYVNGEILLVGLPSAVVANGYEVTIDSSLQLIYYTNADGKNVNIMQYSYGDLPLLHTGKNYIKYNGDVSEIYIQTNERWL